MSFFPTKDKHARRGQLRNHRTFVNVRTAIHGEVENSALFTHLLTQKIRHVRLSSDRRPAEFVSRVNLGLGAHVRASG